MESEPSARLLQRVATGDPLAYSDLIERVYRDLLIAASRLLAEPPLGAGFTQIDLVHASYERLMAQTKRTWKDCAHFVSLATEVMRRVLVDEHRRRACIKRGGQQATGALERDPPCLDEWLWETVLVRDVLERLEHINPRHARIVKYRLFGQMTRQEVSEALCLSPRQVARELRFLRAWLTRELALKTCGAGHVIHSR